MGYRIRQVTAKFSIAPEAEAGALAAIKALALTVDGRGGGGTYWRDPVTGEDRGTCHYSWVNTEEFLTASTLDGAMAAWRWTVERRSAGNIANLVFNGEKAGDDDMLFDAIAPFVRDGSYILMQGEDGASWRHKFTAGAHHKVFGDTVWKEDGE